MGLLSSNVLKIIIFRSIGLGGDGKIRFKDSVLNDFKTNIYTGGLNNTLGIGIIHKTQDIFFTFNGE